LLEGRSIRLKLPSPAQLMSKGLTADYVAILCVTVIAAGFVFRLSQYVANRSLWGDEGALALNIVNRSFLELAEPLDRNQGAPLGFLFVEKFCSSCLPRSYVALLQSVALPICYKHRSLQQQLR